MNTATLSAKFQISIPKEIREAMHLKAGQQFIFIPKGNSLHLVPKINIKKARGIMAGANTENIRDRQDRI